MHLQRTQLVSLSIIGGFLVCMPWVTLPILGSVKGIGNGVGMFSLFCMGVILVISLASGRIQNVIPSSAKIAIGIIGISITLATYMYYSNFKDIAEKTIASSSIPVFGVSLGNVFSDKDFSVEISLYLTGVMGVLLSYVAISFKNETEQKDTQ